MGNPGKYVTTGSGKKGIVRLSALKGLKEGDKIPVEILTEDLLPELKDGKPLKMLCDAKGLKVIGYID